MTTTVTRSGTDADPQDWPGIAFVPSGPHNRIAAALAEKVFVAAVNRLPMCVTYDDGTVHGGIPRRTEGSGVPEMRIHRPGDFFCAVGGQRADRAGGVLHGERLDCAGPDGGH
jgi:cyclopropane-fatty-acyl-phospholipid synthase